MNPLENPASSQMFKIERDGDRSPAAAQDSPYASQKAD
jgi:hypothetical protein